MLSRYKRLNNKGFLLWDAIISLIVITLITHAILMSLDLYRQRIETEQNDYSADWNLLLVILEQELQKYNIDEVRTHEIIVNDGRSKYKIVLENNKIYKKPGHHPYAYNISEWALERRHSFILIEVVFTNQQYFWGLIQIE